MLHCSAVRAAAQRVISLSALPEGSSSQRRTVALQSFPPETWQLKFELLFGLKPKVVLQDVLFKTEWKSQWFCMWKKWNEKIKFVKLFISSLWKSLPLLCSSNRKFQNFVLEKVELPDKSPHLPIFP